MSVPILLRPFLPAEFPEDSDRTDIIKAFKPNYRNFKACYGKEKIPAPADEITIDFLDISIRTYHCLTRQGAETICDIGALTFNDLIAAPNFGVTSLVDLLLALGSFSGQEARERQITEKAEETANSSEFLTQSDVSKLEQMPVMRIPFGLRWKMLPSLPSGLDINSLHLSNRLLNRLELLGITANPASLSNYTLNDLVQVEGLGAGSVIEFVSRIKPYCPGEAPENSPEDFAQLIETLRRLDSIPKLRITSQDRRFGLLLQRAAPGFLTLGEFVAAVRERRIQSVTDSQLTAVTQLIEEVLAARQLPLHDEISSVLKTVLNERNVEIILFRLGILRGEESTLEETGQEFGITRQRVEQIFSRAEVKLGADTYLPVLDLVLEAIDGMLPNTAAAVEKMLQQQDLIGDSTRVDSIFSFARMVGRDLSFKVTSIGEGRLIEKLGGVDKTSQVLRFVRKTIKLWGGARLSGVLEHFAGDKELNPAMIEEIIQSQDDLSWLDAEHEWFWFTTNRSNRVFNRMEKIWSVTPRIKLADLREAIRRHHRMQGSAPPQAILAEMCRQDSTLIVEGDSVIRKEGVLLPSALSQIEQIMIGILRSLGSLANREKFESLCSDAGIARETFYMYIDNSPVMKKFTRGVYGVAGREATLSEVENLRPNYQRGKVVQDFGWMNGNEVWIAYRLSENTVRSGLLGIPEPLKDLVTDSFVLNNQTVAIWRQGPLSIGGYLEESGCQAGDFVAFTFNLRTREIRAELDSSEVQRKYLDY